MRAATELIKIWTEALVPVCNHSRSHAGQELKWLMQHAREQARLSLRVDHHSNNDSSSSTTKRSGTVSLSEREVALMESYIDQRVQGRKPLQYILGTQPFMDLEILTRPPTLIPRWETEEWTGRLATMLKNASPGPFSHPSTNTTGSRTSNFNIIDICTGSGCIPLGLASVLPPGSSYLVGIDVHPKAIELAKENKIKNQALLRNNRIEFHQADLLAPDAVDKFQRWMSEEKGDQQQKQQTEAPRSGYNLVISNPPYIAPAEYNTLEPEVAQWEDPKALLADEDGLAFYPRIAHMAIELLDREARRWRNGPELDKVRIPELVFEIGGDHQVDFVTTAAKSAGFSRVEVCKDLADRARCIIGAR
ncbi:hypothetical protein BGZ99_010169 [Dissophora globulifera]|uniref:Methyltransferase domain-containing protein n=1 Tax=Dissophora globulifera TaxID=979702 RepID=A0A9P6UMG8_9FUNG|nr:hypothetical protein BGZ99_010169 [Dissophora globulifera]